jgi:outer membrane murein-binding lipoprotein Lpp
MDEQQTLDAARQQMVRAKAILDADDYFDGLDQQQKGDAVVKSAQLSTAILTIENTQIGAIADKVRANAEELKSATAELAGIGSEVQEFGQLIAAVGALLGIVGRIVAL